ncbi:hypothetical protein [Cupriavidus necator]|uniref:hypothetical protein n=1 Tax=Cupriavidus necator TaxID=106590 RepID=UPI0005B5143C|nr:hypothetical protein [Cupriavidus necator]
MELKEIEHASISTSGWVVVQASRLEALRKLAAAAQTVVHDWPQVLTDEEVNGGDAVDWIGGSSGYVREDIPGRCRATPVASATPAAAACQRCAVERSRAEASLVGGLRT